jgi:subtilisin family serine protease
MRRLQAAPAPPEDEASRTDWRGFLLDDAALAPPAVTAQSPLIALVDSQADLAHPEFAGGGLAVAEPDRPVIDLHGTATAAVAGAPANGVGMLGLWPGARMLNVGTGNLEGFTCGETVRAISTAIRARAAVLNLSIGSEGACYAQYEAVSEAIARGILVVAAAGNERLRRTESGEVNPVTYPAAFPHVLSVAAFGTRGGSSRFSTANGAVDLAAPGESILTAVPPAFDRDDRAVDGYARLAGTSFAAPIVSGAGAWLLAARPDLGADQVAAVLRRSARDLDARGWDQSSGFGALDLPAALTAPTPGATAARSTTTSSGSTGAATPSRTRTSGAAGPRCRSPPRPTAGRTPPTCTACACPPAAACG